MHNGRKSGGVRLVRHELPYLCYRLGLHVAGLDELVMEVALVLFADALPGEAALSGAVVRGQN